MQARPSTYKFSLGAVLRCAAPVFRARRSIWPRTNAGHASDAKLAARAGGILWQTTSTPTSPFTPSSKRRKGFPSETHVKRGLRVVHAEKELIEKLGRNDPCPC